MPEVVHFVINEDGTMETHVHANGDLSKIFPRAIGRNVEMALEMVKTRLSTPEGAAAAIANEADVLRDLIAQDYRDWPDGHPCRDCDQLAKAHPVEGCEGWR